MKQLILSAHILARFKASTFINLVGLVFSISCALIIIRYIHQERTVNHFCPAIERSYLTTVVDGGKQRLCGSRDFNNDPDYQNPLDDPCVEMVTRFRLYDEDYVLSGSHRFSVQTVVADSLFLTMFPYPVVEGDSRMKSPHDAMITQRLAERLYGNENPIGKTLQTVSLKILSWVVFMLLLVGGFNYINLNTVIMLKRSKELGMKKIFGAKGYEIFAQLYWENFCLIAISLLFTWTIVEVTRGIVSQWLGIPVVQDMRFDIVLSLAFLFLMPLIVTLFPYLLYCYVQPIRSLRGIGRGGRTHPVHILFLFFQYVITIGLIIVAIYFSKQLHYVLNYDLGYRTKDIIQCTLNQKGTFNKEFQSEQEWKAYREKKKAANGLIKKRLDESPLFTHWTVGEVPNGSSFNLM